MFNENVFDINSCRIDNIINNNGAIYNNYSRELEHDFIINKENTDSTDKDDSFSFHYIIYRYKFTKEFMEELYKFSKIHQYDDRKVFKDSWVIWTEENSELVESEICRLTLLGYEGNILDKMFKSARYYFRKKSTEKKTPKSRRQYISVSRELLDKMDLHIKNNINNEDYQPKIGLIEFCKDNEELLKNSIKAIYDQDIKDNDIIQDKIKKTYKNRYFMFITNK